jgi:hypothetical protein
MTTTVIVIYTVLALTFIYDGYALMRKGYLTTISWTLYSASKKWLIIPFLFGILAGHLWFPIFGPDGENVPCSGDKPKVEALK